MPSLLNAFTYVCKVLRFFAKYMEQGEFVIIMSKKQDNNDRINALTLTTGESK